jgi:hypothetical protein
VVLYLVQSFIETKFSELVSSSPLMRNVMRSIKDRSKSLSGFS